MNKPLYEWDRSDLEAEVERLRAALAEIEGLSDTAMADGDGAREIARTALSPGDRHE